jgi:hypothetical protein
MIQINRSQIRWNNGIELEKAYSSKAGWYDLSYPGTWRLDEDEECITFYEPLNDVGVLQISTYLAPSPQSPHDLLVEHFIDRGMTVNQANLQYLEDDYKETASYDYIDNERYYRTWIITSGNYVMFITYICDESKKDVEISIAEAIVASIRFRERETG